MASFKRRWAAFCAAVLIMWWPSAAVAQTPCPDDDPTCVETEVLGQVETRDDDARVLLGGGLIVFGGLVLAKTRPPRRPAPIQS